MKNKLDLSLSAVLFIAYGFDGAKSKLRVSPRQPALRHRLYDDLYGMLETGSATPAITYGEEAYYDDMPDKEFTVEESPRGII